MNSRFNNRLPLSRAQNAVLNPVLHSSMRAQVLSRSKAGFHKNAFQIDTFTCTVEDSENPGHPVQLTGMASLATQLEKAAQDGAWISYEGSIQGSLSRGRRPYVVLSSVRTLAE